MLIQRNSIMEYLPRPLMDTILQAHPWPKELLVTTLRRPHHRVASNSGQVDLEIYHQQMWRGISHADISLHAAMAHLAFSYTPKALTIKDLCLLLHNTPLLMIPTYTKAIHNRTIMRCLPHLLFNHLMACPST